MSSADSPTGSAGDGDRLRRRAQESVRECVAAAGKANRDGPGWGLPLAAVAVVTAAACAPVVLPMLAAGAGAGAVGAVLGQLGGLGGGLITEALTRAWDRLRSRGGPDCGEAALREALAAELKVGLEAGSGAALRAEVSAVLRGVDAVKVAVAAASRESAGLRSSLMLGLLQLGEEFAEFSWVLRELSVQIAVIAEDVTENVVLSRDAAARDQQVLVQLFQMREEVRRALSYHPSLPAVAGSDAPTEDGEQAAAPDGEGLPVRAECPYPGLAAFQPAEASWFFGRDELTATLAARAGEMVRRPGLLVVLGPSGSGKSSLLRAGLIPAVAAGVLPASGSWAWPWVLMTPGPHPLSELAVQLGAHAGVPAGALAADLRADPARVTAAARQALTVISRQRATSPGQATTVTPGPRSEDGDGADAPAAEGPADGLRLVLVVDQFEEVFTQCTDESERQAFIEALCAAGGASADAGLPQGVPGARAAPAVVVLGVRADFYAHCARYPELAPYLQDRPVLVGPMSEAGLRAAIEKPAKAAGLIVDAALVEVLLADLGTYPAAGEAATRTGETGNASERLADRAAGQEGYEAGRLALLSYALSQTWRNRDGRRLTVAGYRRAGGIDEAVAQAAERVHAGLDAAGRDVLRRVLMRLVTFGEGTADTRRRASLDELTGPAGGQDATATRGVLDDLTGARLVTPGAGTVEITHETLLTAWPRLRAWLTEDRDSLRVHRELTDAARGWQHHHQDPGRLFSGTRLAVTAEWAARHRQDLNGDERAFLDAAQRAARRVTHRRRAVTAALVLLLAASLAGAGIAVNAAAAASQQAALARQQAALAASGQLAARSEALDTTDPVTAALLAAAATSIDQNNPAARESLLDAYAQPGRVVLTVPSSEYGVHGAAFSPDGRLLATASADRTVRLWNLATRRQAAAITVPSDIPGGVKGVAFSPDGRILATAGSDGTVRLWNLATRHQVGAPITVPNNSVDSVNGVAFNPDGRLLATAGNDRTVRLWNLATRHQVGAPITVPDGVIGAAFSPDGRVLVTAGGSTARLWNLATRHQVGAAITVPADVDDVAFSPDGRLLATAGFDGTVRLWNLATHHQVGAAITVPDGVTEVAFSPDGRLLATPGGGGTVWLRDVATHHQVGAAITVPAAAAGVAFSPDGRLLATAGFDGTVRLWNLATRHQVGAAITVPDGAAGVAFSPDGRLLATAGGDGTIRLWDVAFPDSLANLLKAVCAIADRSLTPQEWSTDIPSEPFRRVCPTS